MIRRLLGAAVVALALLTLTTAGAWAQAEEEAGPRVFGLVGAEHPFNADLDQDQLLRWGVGVEWPGVMGYEDAWFLGEFQQIGWGDGDVETVNRWNYGVKLYPEGYLGRVEPWIAVGVEHRGGDPIVGQTNYTWFAAGFEPPIPIGWLQLSWQASGWAMDAPNCFRIVVDYVPGGLLD